LGLACCITMPLPAPLKRGTLGAQPHPPRTLQQRPFVGAGRGRLAPGRVGTGASAPSPTARWPEGRRGKCPVFGGAMRVPAGLWSAGCSSCSLVGRVGPFHRHFRCAAPAAVLASAAGRPIRMRSFSFSSCSWAIAASGRPSNSAASLATPWASSAWIQRYGAGPGWCWVTPITPFRQTLCFPPFPSLKISRSPLPHPRPDL